MSDKPKVPDPSNWSCPAPVMPVETVQVAHGGGGRMSQKLVETIFLPALRNPALEMLHDGAMLSLPPGRVAFSTDSYVIDPIFFPGGDIGSLSVHGTVNDLAMCGARPLHLSAAFIIEEGLPLSDLRRIVESMARAAAGAGVTIVTGDTKVVDRGKGDKIFINTTGIGVIPDGIDVSPRRARPGDVVIVSGEIAVHGIAILSVRQGLQFETEMVSDSVSLNGLVGTALDVAGADVHVLRDPTRGGVASALNEIATAASVSIELEEMAIPVNDAVRGACEILGFDPLYVANEGKCLAIVAPESAGAVLEAWRRHPLGAQAAVIGAVREEPSGRLVLHTRIGARRIVDMLSGEQLPRIC
jgi:hydrogenase expression/formation protein HypE